MRTARRSPASTRPACASAADGFPPLPQAADGKISLDAEALVRLADGTFFIADEYGPYIYRFSAEGRMLSAIRPPDAFIPRRDGRDSFSSNNPPVGGARPVPLQPQTGRWNNQGFEGMALTPDGRHLVAIPQAATRQDSGDVWEARAHARMLVYDIADPAKPVLVREHVVPLPFYTGADGKAHVAAQSELLALDATRYLLLCRDGDNGFAQKSATSQFRRVMLVDVSAATNIAGSAYDGLTPVAPNGVLAAGIVPARLSTLVDINDAAMLGRFGLRNGEPNDRDNLSEKWEVDGPRAAVGSGEPPRRLADRRQRQRLHHPGRFSGRQELSRSQRRRRRHHVSGVSVDFARSAVSAGGDDATKPRRRVPGRNRPVRRSRAGLKTIRGDCRMGLTSHDVRP